MRRFPPGLPALLVLASLAAAAPPATGPTSQPKTTGPVFEVTYRPDVCPQPFTGRVYLVVSRYAHLQPLDTVEWFDSEPLFAQDVQDWRPGRPLRFTSDNTLGYPAPLADLPPHTYRVQAVMGLNTWAQHPVLAPGNAVSEVAVFNLKPGASPTVRLVVRRRLPAPDLRDTKQVKYVRVKSHLLSRFWRRKVFLEAAVGLPDAYADDPERRFPTVYEIPGFDGRIERANPLGLGTVLTTQGLEAVVVALAASCPTGHHVFADSANNGPWGQALVTELIPYLEKRFRLIPEPEARYLTGVSSGGWSSLWVQITHPETFGGVWSLSPDPVDFRAFMRVNIYAPQANLMYEPDGSPRVITRPGFFGRLTMPKLLRLERVFGRGGQMGSFAAVFSPRGEDGRPRPLWDPDTGRIAPEVAQAWRKYDIRHVLETNWEELGPRLAGKLHLFCGDRDDFYLEQGVLLLREALQRLGSDAEVEIVPGAGHMLPPRVFLEVGAQMARQFERGYKNRQ